MGRRNESPEKKRRRALIGEFLKDDPIKGGNDKLILRIYMESRCLIHTFPHQK